MGACPGSLSSPFLSPASATILVCCNPHGLPDGELLLKQLKKMGLQAVSPAMADC